MNICEKRLTGDIWCSHFKGCIYRQTFECYELTLVYALGMIQQVIMLCAKKQSV